MENSINVKNRSASVVIYNIPDANIRRTFTPGEVKKVKYSELEQLTYQPGGIEILANFLQILDENEVQSFGIRTQPEYYMNEQQIIDLLKNGSLDAFLDALDFAPQGVLDLIKRLSVQLPLNDVAKRKAIKDKLGFDVETAVRLVEEEKKEDEAPATTAPTRRVEPAVTPGRRTTPQYKVVQKKEPVEE